MAKVSARQRRNDEETAMMRAIVATFTAEQTRVIAAALDTRHAVLSDLDHSYPDPERRGEATYAQLMARVFYRANQARDWIEKGER